MKQFPSTYNGIRSLTILRFLPAGLVYALIDIVNHIKVSTRLVYTLIDMPYNNTSEYNLTHLVRFQSYVLCKCMQICSICRRLNLIMIQWSFRKTIRAKRCDSLQVYGLHIYL